MLISEIYRQNPKTVAHTASVKEVVEEMVSSRVNAFIVVDAKGKPVGIVSLQDIAAATIPRQFKRNIRMAAAMFVKGFFTEMCHELRGQPVTRVMRTDYVSVTLDDNIMAVTADFLKNDLYIVPVIHEEKVVGVITRSEIKKALLYGMRENAT